MLESQTQTRSGAKSGFFFVRAAFFCQREIPVAFVHQTTEFLILTPWEVIGQNLLADILVHFNQRLHLDTISRCRG